MALLTTLCKPQQLLFFVIPLRIQLLDNYWTDLFNRDPQTTIILFKHTASSHKTCCLCILFTFILVMLLVYFYLLIYHFLMLLFVVILSSTIICILVCLLHCFVFVAFVYNSNVKRCKSKTQGSRFFLVVTICFATKKISFFLKTFQFS